MRCLVAIILVFFTFKNLSGQSMMLDSIDFENAIQQLLPQQEYDVDYNDFYDRLFSLYSSPLDLNSATQNDLQSLYILSDKQINDILEYREKFGDFRSIFELLAIEGFDQPIVKKIKGFVTIQAEPSDIAFNSLKNPVTHELFLRYQTVLEPKKGYSPPDTLNNGYLSSRYVGDPGRLFVRYLYAKPGQYSFGMTTEKDPGEKLLWDSETNRYGMDYYSFHAMLENVLIFKKIIVGDFNLDFGQGLVFGSGISIGKGTQPVTTIRRNNLGLRPYRSVFEGKDFSGLAFNIESGKVNINFFLSNVRRDARILSGDTLIENAGPFTNNINSVGLHRTPNEIETKHNLDDKSIGGNINTMFLHEKLEIGINGLFNSYNLKVIPDQMLYRLHLFRGNSNFNVSTYVNYYFKRGHLFSEFAYSKGGGKAHSTGLIYSLSSHIQTSIHYRNYSNNYHNLLGSAFGENSQANNEKGLFWGINITPHYKLLISGYFDYFLFPWLKYRIDAPSVGRDGMLALQYKLNNKSSLRFQYRNKTKSINKIIDEASIPEIVPVNTVRFMADLNYALDGNFSFRTWFQKVEVSYKDARKEGFLIAQDISYNSRRIGLSGRFSIFDSDNYDSRLYLYEKDLLYVFRVPSFYNQGISYYLLAKYQLNRNLTFWFKYSKLFFYNVENIGSGLEEIQGNTKTNASIQLRIKL